MNAIISRPIGIDLVGNLQAQQGLALSQQQVEAAKIANQSNALSLLGRRYQVNNFLNPQSGSPAISLADMVAQRDAQQGQAPQAGPSGAPPPANYLANAGNGAPSAGSPANQLVNAAQGDAGSATGLGNPPPASRFQPIAPNNALAAAQGMAPTNPGQRQPLPPGALPTAATHSAGMPPDGQLVGQQVSPEGAFQTLYGVPIPKGWAASVAFSADPGAAMKNAMEARRSRLQELFSSGDWKQAVTQAYNEGWIDPTHAIAAYDHPEMRAGFLQGLASPDAYQSALEKYSGQSIQFNPVTGQHEISPVALDAKQDNAAAMALGTSQGEMVNAQDLAKARAIGGAAGGFTKIETPVIGPDGKPVMNSDGTQAVTTTYVNNANFARQTGGAGPGVGGAGRGQPAAASPAGWGQGNPPAGGNPLLGDMPGFVQRADGSYGPPPQPGAAPGAPNTSPAASGGVPASPPGVNGPISARSPIAGAPAPASLQPAPAAAPGLPGARPAAFAAPAPLAPTAPSGSPASYPVAFAPPGRPAAGGVATGMPLYGAQTQANIEVQKAAASATNASNIAAMQEHRTEVAKTAQAAVQQNAVLDQMRVEARQYNQCSLADWTQGMKRAWGSIAQTFGTPMPESVAAWEDFGKNSGTITRTTAAQISPRVGVQELQLIQKFLPSSTMSPMGFSRIADQMEGLNDYQIARNAAAANFQGNPGQFEAQFNNVVTPGAFIVSRMPASDLQTFVAGLKQTAEGRATLSRIASGINYAKQQGWLNTPVAQ
jgi:hypothetical protein